MNNEKINPEVLELVKQIPNLDKSFDPEYFSLFAQELFAESDRAAVIVGAANLDGLLLQALKEHVPTERRSGSSFSTRIDLAQIHGIVHKDVWVWLHDLRALRNKFAHQVLPGSDLTDSAFAEILVRLTKPGRPGPIYYRIAEACSAKTSSGSQINLRTRIVAYCEMLRRAIEDPKRMPIRWLQAPTHGSIELY